MTTITRVQRPDMNPFVAVTFTRFVAIVLLLFASVYGAITIIGGASRWSSPAYEVALQVPGAPESWGAALLGASVMGLVGFATRVLPVIAVGFGACAAWSTAFAFSIGVVAARNPGVGWGGVATWVFLALLYMACTAAGAGRFHAPA
ncbi:hypothetical protein IU459_11695 [Nocardia amamiensis]|uniref:Integral membrane protein n=1 Tax=Nocardia amamiensis TaxID=404578 RepID=A0ABS0CQY6_9NOCA|nr:hypothetical protein [Nocardia amamiensis]MBF6298203.1 hypothetical protein [Nocardia amamiensis]